MTILHQTDDGIAGEVIIFECRGFNLYKRPVPSTSAHRAQAGKLSFAKCVITRRFRWIPEKQKNA